jgi:hypothetical protein
MESFLLPGMLVPPWKVVEEGSMPGFQEARHRRWASLAENRWTSLGESRWTALADSQSTGLGESACTIIGR